MIVLMIMIIDATLLQTSEVCTSVAQAFLPVKAIANVSTCSAMQEATFNWQIIDSSASFYKVNEAHVFALQGLGRTLTDCIVRQAGKHPSATNRPPPAYSPARMGPVQMHSRLLNSALSSLDTPEDWRYFGKHALPVCSDAFVIVAEQQMQDWSDDTIEDAGSDRYQHFRPCFAMLCESSRCTLHFLATLCSKGVCW